MLNERVSIMCDKANLAGETIRNEYKINVAYYTEHLMLKSLEERKIIGRVWTGHLIMKSLLCF